MRILTRVTEEYNAAEAAANPRVGFTAEDAPTETTALVSLSKPVVRHRFTSPHGTFSIRRHLSLEADHYSS